MFKNNMPFSKYRVHSESDESSKAVVCNEYCSTLFTFLNCAANKFNYRTKLFCLINKKHSVFLF